MNGISWRIEMKMKLKAEGRARNGMKIRAKPGERKIKLLPFLFTPFLDSSLLRHPNKENQNFMERGRLERALLLPLLLILFLEKKRWPPPSEQRGRTDRRLISW